MRYRIGDDPATAAPGTDEMLLFTVAIGLIVGIVLTVLARHGRQVWLLFWSVGLVLVSTGYIVWEIAG